jgi:Universal stress protein family
VAVTRSSLREGRPANEIVRLIEELGAGLIAVGSKGLGGVRRALMGSVSDSVVRHAHCRSWSFASRDGRGAGSAPSPVAGSAPARHEAEPPLVRAPPEVAQGRGALSPTSERRGSASGVAPWLRPVPKMLRLADLTLYGVGSVR